MEGLAVQRKLVLVVVDAMHPEMLMRAIDEDLAPTFTTLLERGQMIPDCVSSFPSVTPVASSEMMTGTGPAGHWVMGMNWYHRVERRYIEYGSSFEATRTFGLFRAMYDLVYNMNLEHLSWQAETVFERLGDAGIRTATTPFLIYRGRHRHELGLEGLARRAAAVANFRHAVWGPDEFFYGDLYASRPTGCGPTFTRPGTRDEYSACVAEELVREGAYEFLLYSLPDNDFHSHRHGPEATLESIGKADSMVARIIEAGGGLDAFLSDHAVLLTADHAQTDVEHALPLADELAEDWAVLQPNTDRPEEAEIAVSPTSRAGAVYILDSGRRHPVTHERALGTSPESTWSFGWPRATAPRSCARGLVCRTATPSRRWWSAMVTSSASAPAGSSATAAAIGGQLVASPRRWRPTSPAAGSSQRSTPTAWLGSGRR
jgi:predicted AlkP superfamily pyrophosphatase or phosphodiesterase